MSATAKTTPATPAADLAGTATSLFGNGLAQMVEMQKMVIDLTVKQSATTLEALKGAFPVKSQAPCTRVLEAAGQTMKECAAIQKKVLDLVQEQGAAMADAVKVPDLSKSMNTAVTMLQQSAAHTIGVQKSALNIASQQNNAVGDAVRRQFPNTAASLVVESVQRGMDILLENQTEFLDMTAKHLDMAAKQMKQTVNS